MKHINKILSILSAVVLLMSVSCEGDKNGPLPDEGMKEGGVVYLTFQDEGAADKLVDVSNPDIFTFDWKIGALWEPEVSKIQLVIVYNDVDDAAHPLGDYTKKSVLVDNITSLPATGSITMADIVAAVDDLGSTAEIKEGDDFHFFPVVHLKDGSIVPAYDAVGDRQRVRMIGTGIIDAMANEVGVGTIDFLAPVPCAFNMADYVGVKTCVDAWWPGTFPVTIAEDADYVGSGAGIVIVDGLADGFQDTPVKFVVSFQDLSITLTPGNQVWMSGNFYGYGESWLTTGVGVVNTCAKQLVINIGSYQVGAGSFGGGTMTIGPN